MPVPPSHTMWRGGSPYLIIGSSRSGQQYGLGWHDTRKYGRCFLVARLTSMTGATKVLDRFPLNKRMGGLRRGPPW